LPSAAVPLPVGVEAGLSVVIWAKPGEAMHRKTTIAAKRYGFGFIALPKCLTSEQISRHDPRKRQLALESPARGAAPRRRSRCAGLARAHAGSVQRRVFPDAADARAEEGRGAHRRARG